MTKDILSKYTKQPNIVPEVGIVALACCDCGLVHKMGFTIGENGVLSLGYVRDNRKTAQLRRGNFPDLKNSLKNDKWKLVRRKQCI